MNEQIMVSVIMPVYNHEDYLAEAIESVLQQKTTFKYELIIGEDCSTDKSREIVKEYYRRYPDIIRPILWKKNVGNIRNGNVLRELTRGKYIAPCEGDDYWCDKDKLQKQVDFLETNSKYSAVYHNVICVDEKGRKCKRKSINKYLFKKKATYNFETIKGMRLVGQSASCVYKNVYKILSKEQINLLQNCKCNGDQKICAVLACIGDIYYMEDAMACHRVVYRGGSSWSARVYGKNMQFENYNMYLEMCKLCKEGFGRKYESQVFEKELCRMSLNILKRDYSIVNLLICIKVNFIYLKRKITSYLG